MNKHDISLKYGAISPQLEKGDDFDLRIVVETPRGSRHKYALEPKIGGVRSQANACVRAPLALRLRFHPANAIGRKDALKRIRAGAKAYERKSE